MRLTIVAMRTANVILKLQNSHVANWTPNRRYGQTFHNDPITSFQFVVRILMYIFNKDVNTAWSLADAVHNTGMGLAGIYPLEHAEHLVDQATGLARTEKYPLAFSIEPE